MNRYLSFVSGFANIWTCGNFHSFYFEGLDLELTHPYKNFGENSVNLAVDCNKAQPDVPLKNIF